MGHRQRLVALKRDRDPKDDDAHSEWLSDERLSRQEAPVPQRIQMSDELTQPARPPIQSLLAPRTVQADSPKFRSPCCLSPAAAYETQHTLFHTQRTAQPAPSPRKRNNPGGCRRDMLPLRATALPLPLSIPPEPSPAPWKDFGEHQFSIAQIGLGFGRDEQGPASAPSRQGRRISK